MYTAANALMAIIPGCLARVEAIQSKDELIETKVVRECSSAVASPHPLTRTHHHPTPALRAALLQVPLVRLDEAFDAPPGTPTPRLRPRPRPSATSSAPP